MQNQSVQTPLDERRLAAELGVSVRTVQGWRQKGEGPAFMKVGSAVRYPRHAIDAYKASITFTSTSAATVNGGEAA